ncbi:LOW QUALITY PROTEIN: uncharacterized protein LOC129597091 [Paramacrobiotus metropolitanus]|uniref:LOW QUALITY PROTEIN: uncharacterized protein LOC129597091 n=1 Tax=Paramacrobiotus metropolitanus TaxID=2943436 RepID=UPI002445928C|nr:LOW QUALITY PROTEIN: uncharacterized protein LOC129597091 [Paramacrobiotus metropolitanus]
MDGLNLSDANKKKLERMNNKLAKYKAFLDLTKSRGDDRHQRHGDLSPHLETRAESSPDSGIDVAAPKPTHRVMPAEELEHLRARLRAQQKDKLSRPLLFQTHVPPLIQCADVRQLLMYALEGGNAHGLKPSWCTLVRWQKISQIIVVSVENMTMEQFNAFSESDPALRLFLDIRGPLVAQESGHLAQNLLEYPLSQRSLETIPHAKKRQMVSNGALNVTYDNSIVTVTRTIGGVLGFLSPISRLHLLMSVERMAMERYPVHSFSREMDIGHFVPTKDTYHPVSEGSPMFAVDCEMCMTSAQKSELTRISIVNERLQIIYDTYVKPYNPITNYLTRYSGITKAILDPVKTRLPQVQDAIRKILPSDAILCGQSLNGDLSALEMTHPYVIDTSVIYNLKGNPRAKTSLKNLSQIFLSKSIQESEKKGHDSVEDSRTTMELVLLKLKHGHTFGDVTRGWNFSQLEQISQTETVEDEKAHPETSAEFIPMIPPPEEIPLQFPQKRKNEDTSPVIPRDVSLSASLYTQSLLECCRRAEKRPYIAGCSSYVEELQAVKPEVHHFADSKGVLGTTLENATNFDLIFCDVRAKTSDDVRKQEKNNAILMRRISRLFATAPDRSLCVLVLGGNCSQGKEFSGLCCAGIKAPNCSLMDQSMSEPAPDPD